MMRRREFITLLGSATAAATWPVAATAQQAERMRRVGVLHPLQTSETAEVDPKLTLATASYRIARG